MLLVDSPQGMLQWAKESIPPAYVAWRAGTSNRIVVTARQAGNRFLGSLKGLQIRALDTLLPAILPFSLTTSTYKAKVA